MGDYQTSISLPHKSYSSFEIQIFNDKNHLSLGDYKNGGIASPAEPSWSPHLSQKRYEKTQQGEPVPFYSSFEI